MKYIAIFDLPEGYKMGCAMGKMINPEGKDIYNEEDFVNVYIPKRGESDEDYQFVSVNGHTYQIQKDIDVAVPRPIAAVLKQRDSAIKVADRAIRKAQEEFLHPKNL